MWISKRMNSERGDNSDLVEVGKVTIGGESPGVMTDYEMRNVGLFAPGGYFWRPAAGKNILVLKCGDGARIAVAEEPRGPAVTLKTGEVCIASEGGAAVHIRNDGRVNIVGTLLINGAPLNLG